LLFLPVTPQKKVAANILVVGSNLDSCSSSLFAYKGLLLLGEMIRVPVV
jgi:hypothetical protein